MSVKLIAKSVLQNRGNRGKFGRRALGAVAWQLHKRLVRQPKTIELANRVHFRAYPDCVVSSALIYADYPEFEEISFLRANLSMGEVVLDVGANVGHLSMLLSDVVGVPHLHAFEPTPLTFRRLTENWQLNGWPIDGLHHEAVGDQPGFIFVRDTAAPTTTNQVQQQQVEGNVQVPLVALDDCRHRWAGKQVGLLKIDVEGFEPQVFAGAGELLAHDRPKLIMFESLAGSIEPRIEQALAAANYRVFQLGSDGAPDFGGSSDQNLFAVPAERADQLQQARR